VKAHCGSFQISAIYYPNVADVPRNVAFAEAEAVNRTRCVSVYKHYKVLAWCQAADSHVEEFGDVRDDIPGLSSIC